ncbi:hypothetical protein [Micromonospora sp. NPDC051006]|uniref:hypothetical protein n=1 Tax=Micromonospora sp. NPDC051006 TaxID=3364283 RepID=UPI0037B9014C
MQDTVAVALVASLSTLAAAAITGLIGVWASRLQMANSLAVARAERAEQRTARRDQLRRDSYVGFLSACDQAYRRLDGNWLQQDHDAIRSTSNETYLALRTLDEAYNLVLLEGPDDLAREAELVMRSINEEWRLQLRLIRDARSDSAGVPISALFQPERLTAIEERTRRRDSFVTAARAALAQAA